MPKQEIVCGLDAGSNQITCAVGRQDSSRGVIEVLAGARLFSRGMQGGVVVNIGECVDVTKRAIEECEDKIDELVHSVRLGIRGSFVETITSRGVASHSRSDKEINDEDIEDVIDNARATVQVSSEKEIIDIVPQEYTLDRQKGIPNPIGMEGNYLEVSVLIVTAIKSHLTNLAKAVRQAGFAVAQPVYGILAAGDVVVRDEERESGCLLIDFGGQTTGLAVYADRSIKLTKEIPFGSDIITRDVSHAFRTSLQQAREIKEKYGALFPKGIEHQEVDYTSIDGRTVKKTDVGALSKIIRPRFEELFERIKDEIEKSYCADIIVPGGAIITGGGALLDGCEKACSEILEVETRIGAPIGCKGPQEIVANPGYATAIGLLKYNTGFESFGRRNIIHKMSLWRKVRELFS
ncbi:MAG: cell division protein FtsA [Elusimicrobiota bacterium]